MDSELPSVQKAHSSVAISANLHQTFDMSWREPTLHGSDLDHRFSCRHPALLTRVMFA
jgi:hypothetical protein